MDWTSKMLRKRDRVEKGDRDLLGRAVKTDSCKRTDQEAAPHNRGRKRQRYQAFDEDWGMVEVEDHQQFLYSGLEGVKRPLGLDQTVKIVNVSNGDVPVEKLAVTEKNECMSNIPDECAKLMSMDPIGVRVKSEIHNKKNVSKKTWTKLRNGLYGWRVQKNCVRKQRNVQQPGAKLDCSDKSGTPNETIYISLKNEATEKVLTGEILKNSGNSNKEKYEYFGRETSSGDNESERLPDQEVLNGLDRMERQIS